MAHFVTTRRLMPSSLARSCGPHTAAARLLRIVHRWRDSHSQVTHSREPASKLTFLLAWQGLLHTSRWSVTHRSVPSSLASSSRAPLQCGSSAPCCARRHARPVKLTASHWRRPAHSASHSCAIAGLVSAKYHIRVSLALSTCRCQSICIALSRTRHVRAVQLTASHWHQPPAQSAWHSCGSGHVQLGSRSATSTSCGARAICLTADSRRRASTDAKSPPPA